MRKRLSGLSERQKLLEISTLISSTLDRNEVAMLFAQGLESLLEYDTTAIYISNPTDRTLVPIIVNGKAWKDNDQREWTIPIDQGIIGSVIKSGKGERIEDAHLDPRALFPKGADITIEQMIAIPLSIGDNCYGALAMNRMSDNKFTDSEFETARFLASYASLSLNNIHLIEEITQRRERVSRLLRSIPDNPLHVDVMGRIVDSSADDEKETIDQYFPADVADHFRSVISLVLDDQVHREFEYQVKDKHSVQIFEARVVPLTETQCLLLSRNVTTVRNREKQLKGAQSLRQLIMDAVSEAVITIDEQENIIFCNDITEQIFGYPPQDLVGKSIRTILPDFNTKIHSITEYASIPEDHEAVHVSSIGLTGLKRDGLQIMLEVSLGMAMANDKKIFTTIIRDVTERVKAEAILKSTTSRLKNLIVTLQAGILVEDENRHIVLTNQKFCDMFEIPANAEMLVGLDCSDAAEKSKHLFRNPTEFVERILKLIQRKEPIENEELVMASGKAYARDFVPIYVDKFYKGHMWLYRDITEMKEVERNLLKAKQLAEESGNAKQDFLAKMSHELRTPINGVLGLTNLLFNTPQTKESQEFLNGIRSSGEQLLSVVNDILDLAKIEAGKFQLDSIDFNPRHVLTRLAKNLQPQSAEKDLKLEVHLDADTPEYLKGDPVRLNQVILNLVSNALKFTLVGKVVIRCSVDHRVNNTYYMKFAVADTGIGIPEEKLQSIFERFTQADQKTAVKFGGTGLGLTIVKELTEMQKGTIRVESKLNVGTTFEVTLPFKGGSAPTHVHEIESWDEFKTFEGSSILLVEDNVINQLVAKKTLEKWKIGVTIAGNGKVALDFLRGKNMFDLVIMDVQMPEMDGIEATHQIRSSLPEPTKSIPIIAMTASVLFDPEGRVKLAGMNEYISKPFNLGALNALLSKYLQASRKENAPSPSNVVGNTVNLNFLEGLAPENKAFQHDMLELFKKQTEMYMGHIRTAFKSKDHEGIANNAHAYKPLGIYVGLDELSQIVGKLERAAVEIPPNVRLEEDLIRQIDLLIEKSMPGINHFIELHKHS